MHACTPTVTRSLFAREYLFIHQRGALAGVSLMHMYRGRMWLVLWPRQRATISIRTRQGVPTRVGESGSREFRGRTPCASGVRHSTDLEGSQTS